MRKQKRVTVYVPEDDYLKLRSLLILKGKTVSQWVREKIRKILKNWQG